MGNSLLCETPAYIMKPRFLFSPPGRGLSVAAPSSTPRIFHPQPLLPKIPDNSSRPQHITDATLRRLSVSVVVTVAISSACYSTEIKLRPQVAVM